MLRELLSPLTVTRHLCLLVGSLLCAPVASAQVVVVDPGHGGRDPGAVGCESLEEAPTVLDVAQRVQGILEAEGLSVALTREDDRFVELSARAAFANSMGAELYVSVHSNSNGGTPASGTETFVANSASGTSVTMGGFLQEEMILAWGLRDRGLKRANFTVLTATRMPAALTEIAFTNRCDPDAMLLRDPTSRMAMAQAHANAVLRTLDREPGMSGTLTGVVFEDVGVGLEDTTRRLGGATVTAGEMTQTSAADTGAWSFTLPPGTYTVQVSLDGWRSAERSCDVTPRGTTWCSVGVVREAAPADAGAPEPDAGVTVDASAPPPPADAGATPPVADPGCSCQTAPGARMNSSLAAASLLLMALFVFARRRGSLRGGLWLSLLLVGCGSPSAASPLNETAPSTLNETAPADGESSRLVAEQLATPARLTRERPVAEGLTAPVLSPDGRYAALSTHAHDTLFLVTLGASEVEIEAVAQGPRVGYRPVFDGSSLRYRHAQQSPTAVPHHSVALAHDVGPRAPHGLHVRLDEQSQVVLHAAGGHGEVVSPEGDRYIEPSVAADGRHVVFWGMASGLFLHRVGDGATIELGRGGHPQFSADGRWLVFDRTEDDGHVLTAGDLWITDLSSPSYRTRPLTRTPDRIEQMPALAGDTLLFATEEGVLAATVQLP